MRSLRRIIETASRNDDNVGHFPDPPGPGDADSALRDRARFFLFITYDLSKALKTLYLIAFIVLCCFLNSFDALAQHVKLKVTDMRSAKGKIIIILFKDNETFEEERAFRKIAFSKDDLKNGAVELHFTIEPGIYGITLLTKIQMG